MKLLIALAILSSAGSASVAQDARNLRGDGSLGRDLQCTEPAAGCNFGLWNPTTCDCDCIVPMCDSSAGQCTWGCGASASPWVGCTTDCPWFPKPGTEYCEQGDVPFGVWSVYSTKDACCTAEFPGKPCTAPTMGPTVSPTTPKPTAPPTTSPSMSPTTVSPTASPSTPPTASPNMAPTVSPTKSPTMSPSVPPTTSPTSPPSMSPTVSPTTSSPTKAPSKSPSMSPTTPPTTSPTTSPTSTPSGMPSDSPSQTPSMSPSESPSMRPSTEFKFYPDQFAGGCVNDGQEPSWMTVSGFKEHYIFLYAEDCCQKWFNKGAECAIARVAVTDGENKYYPDLELGTCFNDDQTPSFMLLPGFPEGGYMFSSASACCDYWFKSSTVTCPSTRETMNITAVSATTASATTAAATTAATTTVPATTAAAAAAAATTVPPTGPYYPNWDMGKCVADGNSPSWMSLPGYPAHYLFEDFDKCCQKWYKSSDCS